MAREKARLRMDLDVDMRRVSIDERAAVRRAQEKNARIAEAHVKNLAETETIGYGGSDRNRGEYPGRMSDYYTARVAPNGDLILDNPTQRASFFEHGTQPHEIWASGLFARGRQIPPRGRRGRFTRGARALAFDWVGGGRFIGVMVDHPGQDANPIMWHTMTDNLDLFADNIADELQREVARG